jgi:hypothetical protein
MTSATDLDQSPAKAVRRSSAERMRDYRRRRRHGLRCFQVKLGRAELDDLVTKGYSRGVLRVDIAEKSSRTLGDVGQDYDRH